MSRDPAGVLGDINLYRFSYNSPANYFDPNGRWGIQFGSFNVGWGDPSFVFDGAVWSEIREDWHNGLDAIGTIEPTPIADSVNGIIYGLEGDWGNAGISAAGIVPYLGMRLNWVSTAQSCAKSRRR